MCAPDNCDPGACIACDNPPECANICASSTGALSSEGDPESPKDAGPVGSDAEVMP
jgi:hypothetical protein